MCKICTPNVAQVRVEDIQVRGENAIVQSVKVKRASGEFVRPIVVQLRREDIKMQGEKGENLIWAMRFCCQILHCCIVAMLLFST